MKNKKALLILSALALASCGGGQGSISSILTGGQSSEPSSIPSEEKKVNKIDLLNKGTKDIEEVNIVNEFDLGKFEVEESSSKTRRAFDPSSYPEEHIIEKENDINLSCLTQIEGFEASLNERLLSTKNSILDLIGQYETIEEVNEALPKRELGSNISVTNNEDGSDYLITMKLVIPSPTTWSARNYYDTQDDIAYSTGRVSYFEATPRGYSILTKYEGVVFSDEDRFTSYDQSFFDEYVDVRFGENGGIASLRGIFVDESECKRFSLDIQRNEDRVEYKQSYVTFFDPESIGRLASTGLTTIVFKGDVSFSSAFENRYAASFPSWDVFNNDMHRVLWAVQINDTNKGDYSVYPWIQAASVRGNLVDGWKKMYFGEDFTSQRFGFISWLCDAIELDDGEVADMRSYEMNTVTPGCSLASSLRSGGFAAKKSNFGVYWDDPEKLNMPLSNAFNSCFQSNKLSVNGSAEFNEYLNTHTFNGMQEKDLPDFSIPEAIRDWASMNQSEYDEFICAMNNFSPEMYELVNGK